MHFFSSDLFFDHSTIAFHNHQRRRFGIVGINTLIHILLHTLFIFVHGQIIKAGTVGECMFFIASGSVCVTTTNGQELCHLEDGDYFGEIAFILKNRKVRMKE